MGKAALAGGAVWAAPSIIESSRVFAAGPSTNPVSVAPLGSLSSAQDNQATYTVTNVTSTLNKTVLILINLSIATNVDGVTLTGTAISSPVQIGTNNIYDPVSGAHHELIAFRATGTGTAAGTVIVTPASASTRGIVVSVVQLTGDKTSAPIAQSNPTSGASGAPSGTLTTPTAGNGEVLLVGTSRVSTSYTPATNFTELHDLNSTEGNAQGVSLESSWSDTAVTSASPTAANILNPWGAIAIEIAKGP